MAKNLPFPPTPLLEGAVPTSELLKYLPQLFNLIASGPVEHPPLELRHLLYGTEQLLAPTMRSLQGGDIVINEFRTRYVDYLAAAGFTVYVGKKALAPLQNIHDACVESLQASQEVLVLSKTLREASETIRRPVEERGLEFVELGFYGHGMASPESPMVVYRPGFGQDSINGARLGELVLEERMVFGNNIDVFDPRWKLDVGCMFGDIMVVRKGRAQKLVNTPLELPQVG